MSSASVILKKYWGYDSFRPMQENIIGNILEGKDVLALMPTGGGKSLCYQVPAMMIDGICLVISPLIALMKDQVENLRKRNITAYAIYSGMTRKEVIQTLKIVSESNCRFLYVSPERLETTLFKEYLPGLSVSLIAVDEAHCISQWGYDFRPSYLRIASLRDELPHVPVLALTASATPAVAKDICEKLSFIEPTIFRQSFERKNLSYSVIGVESRINKIIEIINKVPGTSIIYCKSRKRTKEISDLLLLQSISSDYYHAGLSQEDRTNKQMAWINNETRVMVCTNAFGMGIDKAAVRTVIHADIPDCLENYYQEAGRAGRDGRKSYAVLLYDQQDIHELEKLASQRFPALDDIKKVYQAIANYLQVPAGTGMNEYYDFDLNDFLLKFKLQAHTTIYALKALEQDEWISLNEQIFLPSQIRFTTGRNELFEFEASQPAYDPIIKALLRGYEGVFDQRTNISEKRLAYILKTETEQIKKQLIQLDAWKIIEYSPQKEKPQVYFIRHRVKTEDLTINMVAYEKRKIQFRLRMNQMLEYVNDTTSCRSRIIASYFGDNNIQSCGICDNCIRQRSTHISKEEFESLQHRITNMVKYESLTAKDLLLKLPGVQKEKAWKVIDYLESENKILTDLTGHIRLK